jgi:hypothetical protein
MDRNRVLKSTTGNPVFRIVERLENFKPAEVMKFYNQLESLFKQKLSYGDLEHTLKICLVLTEKDGPGDWNFFEEGIFSDRLKKGTFEEQNLILINCEGEVIKVDNIKIDNIVDASSLSKKLDKSPLIFIEERKIYFFINGGCIYYIQDIVSDNRIGIITKRCLPSREYRKLIENHYREKVDGEKGFKYWKNKRARLLIHPPEIIFHKPLWSYLNDYVLDGKVDSGVDLGGTSDRTDIRIISFGEGEIGKCYLIEIKCLGRCETTHTEKGDTWANQGILQLRDYLNEEEDPKIGLIVVYDGRKNNQEINWMPRANWHENTDPNPMRFYLISESASVRAGKKLREIKVESNEKGV